MGSKFLPPSVPVKEGLLVKQECQANLSVTLQSCCPPELGPSDLSFRACHCYWPLNVLQNIADRFLLPLSKWFHLVFINDLWRSQDCVVMPQQNSGLRLGREWVQELQSPDPSQLLSSFLGAAPGSRGEGQSPAWHQAGTPTWAAPAPSVPPAAAVPRSPWRLWQGCRRGSLEASIPQGPSNAAATAL